MKVNKLLFSLHISIFILSIGDTIQSSQKNKPDIAHSEKSAVALEIDSYRNSPSFHFFLDKHADRVAIQMGIKNNEAIQRKDFRQFLERIILRGEDINSDPSGFSMYSQLIHKVLSNVQEPIKYSKIKEYLANEIIDKYLGEIIEENYSVNQAEMAELDKRIRQDEEKLEEFKRNTKFQKIVDSMESMGETERKAAREDYDKYIRSKKEDL